MKTVEIIKGTYGHRPGPGKSVKPIYTGKTVELPDEEADRLVMLKVAKHVAAAPVAGMPPAGVATPPADTGATPTGSNIPDGGNGGAGPEGGEDDDTLDIVDGHFVKESVMKLTREDMEALASDLGLDAKAIKSCKNKGELADLIVKVEVSDEEAADEDEDDGGDDTTPPSLAPEAPVT